MGVNSRRPKSESASPRGRYSSVVRLILRRVALLVGFGIAAGAREPVGVELRLLMLYGLDARIR